MPNVEENKDNIREHMKQVFDLCGTGEEANLVQGNKGTGSPWDGLIKMSRKFCSHIYGIAHQGHTKMSRHMTSKQCRININVMS